MRLLLLVGACCLILPACSLNPAEMSTEKLCNRYTAPLSSQRNDPAVRDELLRRGARSCVDPELAEARRQNALLTGLFGPIAGAIHSAANPVPPLEGTTEHTEAMNREIATVRREQADQQRRARIAELAASGATDEQIRATLAAEAR